MKSQRLTGLVCLLVGVLVGGILAVAMNNPGDCAAHSFCGAGYALLALAVIAGGVLVAVGGSVGAMIGRSRDRAIAIAGAALAVGAFVGLVAVGWYTDPLRAYLEQQRSIPTPVAFNPSVEENAPGSLGLDRSTFVTRWNEVVSNPALRLTNEGWQDDQQNLRGTQMAVVTVTNADGTLRSAEVLLFSYSATAPGGPESLSAFSALIDAVLSNAPVASSTRILDQLAYPGPEGSFAGIFTSTSDGGVRFRLAQLLGDIVVLIARQDNL